MNRGWTIAVALSLLLCQVASGEEAPNVVLIANSSAVVGLLDDKSLRKLYLGIPVTLGDQLLTPVINRSEESVYQGFLQHVMFMSDRKYQRLMVSRVYRKGGRLPRTVNNNDELIEALREPTNWVTFMPYQDLERYPDLHVVKTLW